MERLEAERSVFVCSLKVFLGFLDVSYILLGFLMVSLCFLRVSWGSGCLNL